MKSLPIIGHTRRLAAPRNWNHETDGVCHTLEILDRDGEMISAWQPTADEQDRITRGAPIYLHIQGTMHPVVGMSVGTIDEVRHYTQGHCSVCGAPQFESPGGVTCENGHGGADPA